MSNHIYYHATPQRHLASVLHEGLVPAIGDRSAKAGETVPAIYLFTSASALESACHNWLVDEFDEDEEVALLEVRLDEPLPVIPGIEFEAISHECIPPHSLKVLTGDLFEETDIEELLRNLPSRRP